MNNNYTITSLSRIKNYAISVVYKKYTTPFSPSDEDLRKVNNNKRLVEEILGYDVTNDITEICERYGKSAWYSSKASRNSSYNEIYSYHSKLMFEEISNYTNTNVQIWN